MSRMAGPMVLICVSAGAQLVAARIWGLPSCFKRLAEVDERNDWAERTSNEVLRNHVATATGCW